MSLIGTVAGRRATPSLPRRCFNAHGVDGRATSGTPTIVHLFASYRAW